MDGDERVTCAADHPDACAFGPHGVARPAQACEAGLTTREGESAWVAAIRAGRLVRADEIGFDWDVVEGVTCVGALPCDD